MAPELSWDDEGQAAEVLRLAAELQRLTEGEAIDRQRLADAIRLANDGVSRVGESPPVAVLRSVGYLLARKAEALEVLGQASEATATYEEIVARFGSTTDPYLGQCVAEAFSDAATSLLRVGDTDRALAVAGAGVEWLRGRRSIGSPEQSTAALAVALYQYAKLQLRLGLSEAATNTLERVVAEVDPTGLGQTGGLDTTRFVATALNQRGDALYDLGRPQEAVESYERAARVASEGDSAIPLLIANAWIGTSYAQRDLGMHKESVHSADEALAQLRRSSGLDAQDRVAQALISKGVGLIMSGDTKRASKAYDDVIVRFGGSNDPRLRRAVAIALVEKAILLAAAHRYDEARVACDEVERQSVGATDPNLSMYVQQAMVIRDSIPTD